MKRLTALLTLTVLLVAADATAQTFITLACPGARETVPQGVNNRGDVVGMCYWDDGIERAFIYRDGTYTFIGVPGAVEAQAHGLNGRGDVVGSFHDSNYNEHGFLYRNGEITVIDVPAAHATAWAINDRGTILGFYMPYDVPVNRGFIWSKGRLTYFDFPGAIITNTRGINNAGAIVGDYVVEEQPNLGFVYRDGVFSTLEPAGAIPADIDNSGDMLVRGLAGCYIQTRTGVIPIAVPGALATGCYSLSDSGYVTGNYTTPDGRNLGFLMLRK